jgi:hypothetical protein
MQLGFVEDQPPTRSTATSIEWPADVDAHGRGRAGVRASRSGMRVKDSIDDLRDLVLGHGE